MEYKKDWWLSKTLWVAVIQFVIAGLMVTSTNHPELGWILMLKSILDFILRLITTEPIK